MASIFHETCSLLQLLAHSVQAMIQSHLMQMAMVIGPSSSWIFLFLSCAQKHLLGYLPNGLSIQIICFDNLIVVQSSGGHGLLHLEAYHQYSKCCTIFFHVRSLPWRHQYPDLLSDMYVNTIYHLFTRNADWTSQANSTSLLLMNLYSDGIQT